MLCCISLADIPSGTAAAIEMQCAAFSWTPVEKESTRQSLLTGTLQLHIENLSVKQVSKDTGGHREIIREAI